LWSAVAATLGVAIYGDPEHAARTGISTALLPDAIDVLLMAKRPVLSGVRDVAAQLSS
jgi:hypothetical protein